MPDPQAQKRHSAQVQHPIIQPSHIPRNHRSSKQWQVFEAVAMSRFGALPLGVGFGRADFLDEGSVGVPVRILVVEAAVGGFFDGGGCIEMREED